jgi:hypothetical protein
MHFSARVVPFDGKSTISFAIPIARTLIVLSYCVQEVLRVFVDLSPVSSNSSASSSGPAPEVAPESNIPVFLVFLFAIFCAQCAATLLRLLSPACADNIISMLVGLSSCSSLSSFSSCASTRQDSGDQ